MVVPGLAKDIVSGFDVKNVDETLGEERNSQRNSTFPSLVNTSPEAFAGYIFFFHRP